MAPLSADDLLALEAIADIDDDANVISGDEDDVKSRKDSEFGSDSDSLFDLLEDDGEWTAVALEQTKSHSKVRGQECDVSEVQRTQDFDITANNHSKALLSNSLKRAALAEDVIEPSKPAKLEKSFSEGLDEIFNRVSLDTVPDDEIPIPQHSQPKHQSHDQSLNELDVQLAIEQEIVSTVASSTSNQSAKMALPDFRIPRDIMERAVASNERGPKTFWSHTLYRGPHDQRVTLFYARNKEQSEQIAKLLLNEPILGFDLEWATFGPLQGIKRQVSLVQLACEDKTALFHIALHQGETVEELFAPSLRQILESPDILKTGNCCWRADGSRLLDWCNIKCQGLIELSQMYKVAYETSTEKINNRFTSLAHQTERVLGLPLEKDNNVRASRWELELSQRQILYAANDAYAGYMVYRHLEHRRLVRWPERRRPEFAELQINMRQQYGSAEAVKRLAPKPSHSCGRNGYTTRPASHESHEKELQQQPGHGTAFSDQRDIDLYQALLRHKKSITPTYHNTNPAHLPSNAILQGIVVARPTTEDALAQVKGIGPTKIRAHGKEWLQIVGEHLHLWADDLTQEPPVAKFRVPPQLPAQASEQGHNVSERTPHTPMHVNLLKALRKIRTDLLLHSTTSGVELPSNDTLQALAQIRPRSQAEFTRIPGVADFDKLARTAGIDVLAVVREYAGHRTGRSRPREAVIQLDGTDDDDFDEDDENDDDNDAFQTMQDDGRRRVSIVRWVV